MARLTKQNIVAHVKTNPVFVAFGFFLGFVDAAMMLFHTFKHQDNPELVEVGLWIGLALISLAAITGTGLTGLANLLSKSKWGKGE